MKKTKKEIKENKKQSSLLSRFNLTSKKSPILITLLAGAMSFLLILAIVLATQPTIIGLQGTTTDSSGNPVNNGTLEVNISSATSCNGNVYSEIFNNAVQNGKFNVTLGDTSSLDLDYNSDYYLCLTVDSGDTLGPSLFRGGQGEISEEDIDITNLTLKGNLSFSNGATIVQSTLNRLWMVNELIADNIIPESGGKTLGNSINLWSNLFIVNINATGNISAKGEVTGGYISLMEKGKTAGRQITNLDWYSSIDRDDSTLWFRVDGINGTGTGIEADPYQIGEVKVAVGKARQIYVRTFNDWINDSINPNNLISYLRPDLSNPGVGLTTTSGTTYLYGYVEINETGIFKTVINNATGGVDSFGFTIQGYVAKP